MRVTRLLAAAGGVLAAAAVVTLGPAAPASAATDYTHATTLTGPCFIHANFPKAGVPDWGWTKNPTSSTGATYHLGVRYTYKGYALVLDYVKADAPSWGWAPASCLTDPRAYDQAGNPLPDLRAPGGSGAVKDVPISAPHDGLTHDTVIHVGSGQVGTLRSGAKSFVIGNVRGGDPFEIPAAHCGTHSAEAWILGYAPNSGRWGYVQAQHLPACV